MLRDVLLRAERSHGRIVGADRRALLLLVRPSIARVPPCVTWEEIVEEPDGFAPRTPLSPPSKRERNRVILRPIVWEHVELVCGYSKLSNTFYWWSREPELPESSVRRLAMLMALGELPER